jgi:alpha-1,6-mannosyltransferase
MFYAAEGGGVRTYLTAKADWLMQRSRIRHTIVAPGSEEEQGDIPFVGVPSIVVPHTNGYRMPLSTRIGARVLQRLQPDLIEVGDPYQFAWSALRVKRELNVPVVAFYHSDLQQVIEQRFGPNARRAAAKYASYLYRKFDLVLAPSKVMVQRLQDMGVDQVRHQPLGVDTSVFTPQRRDHELRERLGLPRDARLLVYAGRFAQEKKLPLLLEAVHRLGHPYYLLMIGSGCELPASPRLIQIPFQRNPKALAGMLASCDLLVHPGDQETFGLVILEAMACGIPVVGMAAGGVSELLDSDTGLLVKPGSVTALEQGIRDLYDSDRMRLGANARRRVLEKYDWNLIIPQLIAQYANLFAARQRAELEAGLAYAVD